MIPISLQETPFSIGVGEMASQIGQRDDLSTWVIPLHKAKAYNARFSAQALRRP